MATKFVCQQCGYSQVGWLGRCPNCGTWASLVETITEESRKGRKSSTSRKIGGEIKLLELARIKGESLARISSGIGELDRVLGGGLVAGQAILLAGEPGIGKSTILSQVAEKIYPNNKEKKVLYISGEEVSNQIKLRTKRLGLTGENVFVLEETDVDSIVGMLEAGSMKLDDKITSNPKPQTSYNLIIIDSIQTLSTEDLSGVAGSVGQIRETSARIIDVCKKAGIPLFLVGHVTKEGAIAGPRVLEHMVDTVLWFEGERRESLRILRAVKNRFGPTDEVGIFTMEEEGLIAVENPSVLFVSDLKNVPGSVPTILMEGTRPIIVEVQALAVPTKLPFPKRTVQGVDIRRVEMLLAVATRRLGFPFGNFDVFVNAAGGINIREPASDLAIILALSSALANKPLPASTIAFGEVGLLGEVRTVSREERRTKEARRLGFRRMITSRSVKTVGEAIKRYC